MNKHWQIIIVIIFLWIGFVCAISFMEAWLKFQAPGITLPLGLGIGRIVFHALNKVEWVFAISISLTILFDNKTNVFNLVTFGIALTILALQTFYLLPLLDSRAAAIIAGEVQPPSTNHLVYIIVEFIKVISLFTFGIRIFPKALPIE